MKIKSIILLMCMVWLCDVAIQAQNIPNNEIHYTAYKKLKTHKYYNGRGGVHEIGFNTRLKSHKFKNGKGVLIFQDDVKTIGMFGIVGCYNLISITIPSSVTSLSDPFIECTGIQYITVESGNPKYDSRNNCNAIIETKTNTLIRGCKNTVIPNSVTSIASGAFIDCESLRSIEIPNSVTSIGSGAFRNCSNLISVSMPENCYIENKYSTFYGCNLELEINNTPLHKTSSNRKSTSSSPKQSSSNNFCSRCNGSGVLMFSPCPFCGGTGRIVWNVNPNNVTPGGGNVTPSNPTSGGASGGSSGGYSTPKQNSGRSCPECHGTGNCQICNGSGLDYSYPSNGTRTCAVCHGRKKCTRCNGTGKVY